jgi:hypothetical protein
MPGPAALIALAARLGIPKAAELLAKKGFKYVQKLVSKAQQQITKQQKTSGKKFTGEGSKRKQKTAIQRKKPKVDSGLSIKKSSRSGKGKRSRKVPISETGKGYAEQAYKTNIKVKVKFKDGKTITDNIKGMNEGHALARAKSNWPGSAVIKIK